VLTLWGSIDADLRLVVDRSGRINVPRVGPIMVSGVKYAELSDVISRRVALVFKNFQLSVSLGQLRGLRVYVTGFVQRPGVQVVSSLSTLAQTLMRAGGPSAAGSFRSVQLRRGKDLVATFDLYDLLLKGDREADRVVQAEDVIHVGAIGPQVAVIGSVNRPAIFELKAGETVDDALRMAGGFAAVADTSRLAIERLDERNSTRVTQIDLPAARGQTLRSGDMLRAFNAFTVALPVQRQNKRVRIEGEVAKPGEYVMPAHSSLLDLLIQAGGLTPGAFLFGAEFNRESVRLAQQQNYDRALRDVETDMARASSSKRVTSSDDALAQSANAQTTNRLVERLRAVKPSGRVVLRIPVEGGQLPEMALEDGDKLYIPPKPTVVGVFGSVFNSGSYLYTGGKALTDYLRQSGGPTRGADESSIFVIRANGGVVSSLDSAGWFIKRGSVGSLPAEPGDTIFVPEEIDKSTFIQSAKDWTQILYQLGIGIAGIKSAVR
jgi:protein involved in polysaccharide export with SLBB domain